MIIRKMTENDIVAVKEVAEKSWNDTYAGIIPLDVQTKFLHIAYNPDQLKKRMENTHIFVAEIAGKVTGFANFLPVENGVSELAAIYLHPASKGKGIGTALLQKGIKSLGIEKVIVHVEKDNHSGMIFYHAKGFQKESEFENDLFGHTLKIVRMTLKVGGN